MLGMVAKEVGRPGVPPIVFASFECSPMDVGLFG